MGILWLNWQNTNCEKIAEVYTISLHTIRLFGDVVKLTQRNFVSLTII